MYRNQKCQASQADRRRNRNPQERYHAVANEVADNRQKAGKKGERHQLANVGHLHTKKGQHCQQKHCSECGVESSNPELGNDNLAKSIDEMAGALAHFKAQGGR